MRTRRTLGVATLVLMMAVSSAQAADIRLAPEEQDTAAAILAAPTGGSLDATVAPKGCNDSSCQIVAHVTTPSGPAANNQEVVKPLNGAVVANLVVRRPLASAAAKARAAAVPAIYYSVFNGDRICNLWSCALWRVQLNSKMYCDGKYAWGSRSRYGYAGYADGNGTSGFGVSIAANTGFNGDPSRSDLYAYNNATIYFIAKGMPAQTTAYVHRHFTGGCGSWLVVG